MIHVEPDQAMYEASQISPDFAVTVAAAAGPERLAALMMAIDSAMSGNCPCDCCVSMRAIGEGWRPGADST